MKGFINAEVIHADILLEHPQYKDKLNKHSKKEGKTYKVKEGDILHFNSKFKWDKICFPFLIFYSSFLSQYLEAVFEVIFTNSKFAENFIIKSKSVKAKI